MHETLENIQNHVRSHVGKITGKEFQPALGMLKEEFQKNAAITPEEKPAFDLFFEKLRYKDNGKGAYPGLAFLLAALEFKKVNKKETLQKMEEFAKNIVKELTPRMWENSELVLNPLQKIVNACRDSTSFLNPRIAKTYEYEIKASLLTSQEKEILLAAINEISGK